MSVPANRRLLVDLDAVAANYGLLRGALPTGDGNPGHRMGAVVKANAYGLGAEAVARRLVREGCRSLFVATLEEGLTIRRSIGAEVDVFVFEGIGSDTAADCADAALIPVLNSPEQTESWKPFARHPMAIHVDTGMSRLGFGMALDARDFKGFSVRLLMTHLACADEPEHPLNTRQVDRFDRVRRRFPGVPTSVGNSAGCLLGGRFRGDLGRPGIGLYGGNPFAHRPNPLRPAAALQGRVLQIKTVEAGESVGYGAAHVLERPTRVAVIALGYADGLPRQLSGIGSLHLGGHRCPILGRVSMDLCVVEIGELPVHPGDWAECFGARIPVDEVAEQAGTIAYSLLTGVGERVPRIPGRLLESVAAESVGRDGD